nr:flavin reductase family protein [Anaerosporobacter faecicola]
MNKEVWKAGNMLYPLPVVMVSCKREGEKPNIITVAWAGTVCTNPPMVSISVRPERYSYDILAETKEFVINLTTRDLARATDYCGVRSGRDVDKYKEMGLQVQESSKISAPGIKESPVNIECKLKEIIKLGSHDLFLANVEAIQVDRSLLTEKGKLELGRSNPIVYSHGEYYDLGNLIGTFGYSVKKSSKNSKQVERGSVTRKTVEKSAAIEKTKHKEEYHSKRIKDKQKNNQKSNAKDRKSKT